MLKKSLAYSVRCVSFSLKSHFRIFSHDVFKKVNLAYTLITILVQVTFVRVSDPGFISINYAFQPHQNVQEVT